MIIGFTKFIAAMAQVQVRFHTKQSRYSVPEFPFSVPASVEIGDLNSLINSLLVESYGENNWKLVEFDFLIGNEFLRLPLEKHLEQKDITTETVVDVEYLEKHPPPAPEDSLCHDDWVSAVQGSENWFLTGCYDNTLHIWGKDGERLMTIPGHEGPVKAVCWLKQDYPIASFVSASHDQNAMIWEWNSESNSVECVYVCRGHERSVECVAASADRNKLATGSWDKLVKIWSILPGEMGEVGEECQHVRKRIKTESGRSCKNKTPIMTLAGHNEAIAAIQWTDSDEICSASWDHTIRLWNVELGGMKEQLVGNKSFFDMSYSPLNQLLITASADSHVRLWDPRVKAGSTVRCAFSSHTGWVTCVKWSTVNEFLFISGSQDCKVKQWDIRCPQASLYDMCGHSAKVLCCDWSNAAYILSGGEDNQLKVFSCEDQPMV